MHRLDYSKHWLLPLLILILAAAALLGITLGGVELEPLQVVLIILHELPIISSLIDPSWPDTHQSIIVLLRLPRVLLAGMVGAGLALAGAAFQGLLRNPMADPYVIGVSSGAALGAVIGMLLQSVLGFNIPMAVPGFAFIFAMATIFVVYELARTGSQVPVMTLLLAGIAVGSLLSALVSLCMYLSGSQLHQLVFWLMGGFSGRGWIYVHIFLPYGLLGAGVIFIYSRELNVLLLGEEPAQHLGIEVEKVKRNLLIAAALITGACVAVGGLIGFVGLIIPHIVRMLIGPDHRLLLPAVAALGGVVLILADLAARVVVAPGELPVGIVTALLGAPFFIYLLRKQKSMF
ncbi:MAG: FecCD family ABC transporter permease [Syntrophomonadaceae bacterium]|jgi:iron complex transport system permease protein